MIDWLTIEALAYSILVCYKRVIGQGRVDRWKLAR